MPAHSRTRHTNHLHLSARTSQLSFSMISLLLQATLWAVFACAQFNYPDPYIPCGNSAASPCSDDTYCIPDSDDCVDLAICSGACVFKNTYASCGGHTIEPHLCEGTDVCADDPRAPGSCGMACDKPGICIPAMPSPCDSKSDLKCPEGMWRYSRQQKEYGSWDQEECPSVCL